MQRALDAAAKPANVAALSVLMMSYLAPGYMMQFFRFVLTVYLGLAGLSLALTVYHKWNFRMVKPQEGHFALVTGATSGLGEEIARQLAAKGYSLVLASRTESSLEVMAKKIRNEFGVEARFCACDLSSVAGIKKLEQFAREQMLVVDILVNNAGSSVSGDLASLTEQEIDHMMMLDTSAVVRLTHAIVPQMAKRGIGHVLNISSMAGSLIIPTAALYCSSKSFVMHFSESIDYELRSTGVSVTCICPGPIHTNFGKAANCEAAIYFHSPGAVTDVKDSAKEALRAMFAGETLTYDSLYAYLSATVASVAPRRALAAICAINQNEPSQILSMLKR